MWCGLWGGILVEKRSKDFRAVKVGLESVIEMVLWSWRLVGWETDGRGRKVTLYT